MSARDAFTAWSVARTAKDWALPVTVGLLVHPSTRSAGKYAASYLLRATGAASWAYATTPFVAGGTFSLASLAGSVAVGYGAGVAVGWTITNQYWGKKGSDQFLQTVTSPSNLGNAIWDIPKNATSIGKHYWREYEFKNKPIQNPSWMEEWVI